MNKKKIALLALSLCMIAILAVGGSLAYLTSDDNHINTFTTGNVEIMLDEAKVKEDPETDNLVKDGETRIEDKQDYKLHPNMTVAKDPTITVKEGSERTYLGAIVTVKGDIYSLYPMENDSTKSLIDINKIASGGLLDESGAWGTYGDDGKGNALAVFQNDNYAVHQIKTAGENEWKLYVFMKEPRAAKEKVILFEQLTIDPDYDNAEMAKLNGMTIEVEAFGVQADGFEVEGSEIGCYNAMTEAFATQWNFGNGFKTVEEA